MKYVEAPENWQRETYPSLGSTWFPQHDPPAIFLAGGITACPEWQAEAVDLLKHDEVTVLNPRRADFPIDDPSAAEEQIKWEFNHLRKAEVVLFWFEESPSPQPIAMYELGRHAAPGRKIAVGCHPNYSRNADLLHQMALGRPDVIVHHTLEETVLNARVLVRMP